MEIIKEIRIKKGMTQQQLADESGVTLRTIQRIENGDVNRVFTP
ncbi:MAG: helix-turn-helix transcriptional regulator [Bacteroidota bacterium]